MESLLESRPESRAPRLHLLKLGFRLNQRLCAAFDLVVTLIKIERLRDTQAAVAGYRASLEEGRRRNVMVARRQASAAAAELRAHVGPGGFFRTIGMRAADEGFSSLAGDVESAAALGYELALPERRAANIEAVLSACPSLEFIIDGTERPINRPKDKEKQKSHYSGKKKAHTVKNNLITERGGKIKYLSRTCEGKRHDKKLADEENYCFPSGSKLLQDTGFQGYRPEGVTVIQPKKKPRGRELAPDEKILNRAISSLRVEVEHRIGGVKRSQIVVQPFRNRVENFVDEVMETACGLHNFRLTHRLG